MKKNNFVEGTLIATISVILTKLMGLLYVIPFYAIVGKQGGALYGYAYNIYAIFISISTMGIPIAISKITSEYHSLKQEEAKLRAYKIGIKIVNFIAIISFVVLFVFAKGIASLIIGNLTGGNTIEDVTIVIRAISFAILVIPYLSLTRGYFQGHNYISPSSNSQIIEQVIRILVIIFGSYLAFKVFNKSLTFTVSVAVTGAFFGGVISAIYLKYKMSKHKEVLGVKEYIDKDKVTNKEIYDKIIKYTVPYLILNLGAQLYTFVDMLLILRTLGHLGYNATDVEFIASAVSTWGNKLNVVIQSLATGLSISLIPNMVSSFIKKDWKDAELKINQSLEMIVVIAIPVTIGISMLSTPIWTMFYGYSQTGSEILKFSIYTALFSTVYITSIAILQGLNKFKSAYIAGVVGFLINGILDIPLMILFHKIGLPAIYGAVTATILGYSFSIFYGLFKLSKEHKISYKESIKTLGKTLVPIIAMVIVVLILNYVIPYNDHSKMSSFISSLIKAIIGGTVYLLISYKMGILSKVFGKEELKKIINKLSFNLINKDKSGSV